MAPRDLTAPQVRALKDIGTHRVSRKLYLQIKPNGARSWVFRYGRDGKTHWHGLGAFRDVSLQEARDLADELHTAVKRGAHPVEDRREERKQETAALASKAPTFDWCAAEYIKAHEAGWKSAPHRQQWRQTLTEYAGKAFGSKPVDQVDVDDVHRALKELWTEHPESAGRLRGRISKVLGWAKAKGYRSGDDPAARGGPLDHLLPPLSSVQTIKHHDAVPWKEMPEFYARLREMDSQASRVLQLIVLTAARSGEARGALWSEVDLEQRLWTVPASRMKMNREHRVPLSDLAVELLEAQPRDDELVFPGGKPGEPLSYNAPAKCLSKLRTGQAHATVHGMRSSFRDWAAEAMRAPREVAELCLAHNVRGKVERAYARSDLLDERRELMQAWADYLLGL